MLEFFMDTRAVVIDQGSHFIRSGFSGDDAPRSIFTTAVGRQRLPYKDVMHSGYPIGGNFVGNELETHRGYLSLDYPIERGIITNWDDMEKIWHHIFYNELRACPEEFPVLVSEPPLNPKFNREMMAKVMFEKFKVPGFFVVNQGMLSNYACGRGTALMVDIGDGVTHIVPIYEGYCLQNAIRRIDFGGKDLTLDLQMLLHKKGHTFISSGDLEIVRDIKEKLCYVADNFDNELSQSESTSGVEKTYELPDGNIITLDKERFSCPEGLFKQRKDLGFDGIHKLIHDSMMTCDIDVRRDHYCNIILSGGTTTCQGFPERLQKEMSTLLPQTMKTKVVSAPERKFNVWIGGSIIASLSTFQTQWITLEEYGEHGPNIVHRKCF